MTRRPALPLLLVAVGVCMEPHEPFISGEITWKSQPGMMPVVIVASGSSCNEQARVYVGSTRVSVLPQLTGVPADTASLTLGRRVAVWIEGGIAESCPPLVGASRILIIE